MSEMDTQPSTHNTLPSTETWQSELTRRAFLVGAGGLALTAAFGCRSSGQRISATASTVVVTPFDISASAKTSSIQERYFEDFQMIVNSLDSNAFLAGYPITGDTEATSLVRIHQAFPPAFNLLEDNKDKYDAKLAEARANAVSQARALMTGQRAAPATDLLNAFQDASAVFNGAAYKSANDKRLIVFSDMIQQADKDDFMQEDLTEQRVSNIIAAQRAAGQLPPLQGVRVWAAGATADAEGRISPDKIAQIRRFWIAFFQACGASLTPERYGTTLMNYP